jgi:hypothetical protein
LITIPETLRKTSDLLRRIGRAPEESANLLAAVTEQPDTHGPIRALKAAVSLQDDSVERVLLWYAAQQHLPKVDFLPVADDVKRLLGKELRALPASNLTYAAGSYLFTWAARVATFRRFPAGVMDWELSGIPRSWLLRAPLWDLPSLLSMVARQLRGVRPCFFLHVAPKPRNRALIIEKEVMRAYCRMARSLELQPGIKAIVGAAWFFDPAALKDNAHLEYLQRPFRDHGGVLTTIGPAPPDSGFLDGNAKRRQQYEAGELQYRTGLAIWPRRAALEWAAANTELVSCSTNT